MLTDAGSGHSHSPLDLNCILSTGCHHSVPQSAFVQMGMISAEVHLRTYSYLVPLLGVEAIGVEEGICLHFQELLEVHTHVYECTLHIRH